MPLMETAYLLNPPRKRRKARRRRGKARRSNVWRGEPRRHAAAARKGWRKRKRRGTARRARRARRRVRRAANPVRRRRRRSGPRRRRNPNGVAGVLTSSPMNVIDLRIPIPGFIGKIVNNIAQGVIGGAVVFGSYTLSGVLVDMIHSKSAAAAATDTFKQKWFRPLLFAGSAGLLAGLMAVVAPKGKRGTWALLAAAGPGLRAAAGMITAILPADSTGVVADIRASASALGDFIQVEGSNGSADSMGDFLQVDGLYEAGMGTELYEAGMGTEDEEEVTVGI